MPWIAEPANRNSCSFRQLGCVVASVRWFVVTCEWLRTKSFEARGSDNERRKQWRCKHCKYIPVRADNTTGTWPASSRGTGKHKQNNGYTAGAPLRNSGGIGFHLLPVAGSEGPSSRGHHGMFEGFEATSGEYFHNCDLIKTIYCCDKLKSLK